MFHLNQSDKLVFTLSNIMIYELKLLLLIVHVHNIFKQIKKKKDNILRCVFHIIVNSTIFYFIIKKY